MKILAQIIVNRQLMKTRDVQFQVNILVGYSDIETYIKHCILLTVAPCICVGRFQTFFLNIQVGTHACSVEVTHSVLCQKL